MVTLVTPGGATVGACSANRWWSFSQQVGAPCPSSVTRSTPLTGRRSHGRVSNGRATPAVSPPGSDTRTRRTNSESEFGNGGWRADGL